MQVLHIINQALPDHVAGYTIRSHSLLATQKSLGLLPTAFITPHTPVSTKNSERESDFVRSYQIDGVPYLGCNDQSGVVRKSLLNVALPLKKIGIRGLGRLAGKYQVRPEFMTQVAKWICENVSFSVIHAHSPSHCFDFANEIRAISGKPILYEVRGFYYLSAEAEGIGTEASRTERIEKELKAMQSADCVSTLGNAMKQHLIDLGLPDAKIHLFPNGVDISESSSQKRNSIRKEYGLTLDDFVCGCFTNIRRLEGLETAIRAVNSLSESGHPIKFVIAGNGTQLEPLKKLVTSLGCENQILFLGRRPMSEIADLYSILDTYLIPRINKPVCQIVAPVKILGPMLHRVPLIVSDLPALTEHTGQDRGLRFTADDHQSLAKSIADLMNDRHRAKTLAENAYQWAITERCWSKIALDTKAVYQSMC